MHTTLSCVNMSAPARAHIWQPGSCASGKPGGYRCVRGGSTKVLLLKYLS
jgi:hypothetical protein